MADIAPEPQMDQLLPLADLIERTGVAVEGMMNDVENADPEGLVGRFAVPQTARDCLRHAGALDESGMFTPGAQTVLLAASAIAWSRRRGQSWKPILTVPAYLRPYLSGDSVVETAAVLRQLVHRANKRLILAAPFFDAGIGDLLPSIAEHINERGECLLVTRDLVESGARGHNRQVVDDLRRLVRRPDRLHISWWGGATLGVHLKVVISDEDAAYVGSANFTRAGLGEHLEVGVLLEGVGVGDLADLVTRAAEALDATHVWQAR